MPQFRRLPLVQQQGELGSERYAVLLAFIGIALAVDEPGRTFRLNRLAEGPARFIV